MFKIQTFILLVLMITFLLACCKEKIQKPIAEEPSKWEIIPGDYKVYDTLGGYLYDMSIEYISGEDGSGKEIDSLRFNKFNNDFVFTQKQNSYKISDPINIGVHNPILDWSGNSWQLSGPSTSPKDNRLINDTLFLRYNLTNIQYYLQDLVPYFECNCKQIAVKQH